MATDEYYAKLEEQYVRGDIDWSAAGEAQHGDAAHMEAQTLLMQATDTQTIDDAIQVALGRPRLSAEPNETIRIRVPKPLMAEVRSLAKERRTTVSHIVREAMSDMVDKLAA